MAWIWAIMTIFALPAIIINTYGPGDETNQPANGIAMTTLRNLYARNEANTTFTLPLGYQLSQSQAAAIYTGCDFVSTVIFIIGYLWMRSYLNMEQKVVDGTILTASDYSIYLPWLPPDTTANDIIDWVNKVSTERFNRVFPIVDINIVENNSAILSLMEKRARLMSELIRVRQKLKFKQAGLLTFSDEVTGCFSALSLEDDEKILERRINKCIQDVVQIKVALASKTKLDTTACAAFITFESVEDKEALEELYPSDSYASYLFQPQAYYFKNQRVRLTRAPEPSAVMWHNLHVTQSQQTLRTTVSNTFSLFVIIFSFLLIFFASWKSNEYESLLLVGNCKDRAVSAWVKRYTAYHTIEEDWSIRNGSATPLQTYCLCDTFGWTTMKENQVIQSPWFDTCKNQACDRLFNLHPSVTSSYASCKEWTTTKTNALLLSVGASLAILLVNQSLGIILRFLAEFEGHHSIEFRDESVAVRLFFAQFFNTAVLMILINIAWPTKAVSFATSRYTDITAGWYDNVGAQLITTMMINWVSPHVFYIVSGLVLRYRISRGNIKAWAQDDLNQRYLGYPMDLSLRQAQLINVAFVTYSFSTGMPLLIPVGAVSFFLAYWVDKLLFIRYFAKPAFSSTIVTKTMSALLPIAIILHLGFGVWMLGSIGTFNRALSGYSPIDYEKWLAPYIGKVGVDAPIDSLQYDGGEPFFVVDGQRFNTSAQLEAYYLNTTTVEPSIGIPPYERIFSPSGIPLLALFILVYLGYALSSFVKIIGKSLIGLCNLITLGELKEMLHHTDHNFNLTPVYTVAICDKVRGTPLSIIGTPSYNILAQPELQRRLHIHPRLALISNSLSEVIFTDDSMVDAEVEKAMARMKEENLSNLGLTAENSTDTTTSTTTSTNDDSTGKSQENTIPTNETSSE